MVCFCPVWMPSLLYDSDWAVPWILVDTAWVADTSLLWVLRAVCQYIEAHTWAHGIVTSPWVYSESHFPGHFCFVKLKSWVRWFYLPGILFILTCVSQIPPFCCQYTPDCGMESNLCFLSAHCFGGLRCALQQGDGLELEGTWEVVSHSLPILWGKHSLRRWSDWPN